MAPEQSPPQNNDKLKALENLNWPTVILILFTGGGNLVSTFQNREKIDSGRDKVISQVNDLHNALDDFEKRQKDLLEGMHDSLRNQSLMINNQNEMLKELKNHP